MAIQYHEIVPLMEDHTSVDPLMLVTSNLEVILSLLNSYPHSDEMPGRVYEFEIVGEVRREPEGLEFYVGYKVSYYYACDALSIEHDHTMNIKATIDAAEKVIRFTGETWPEREPDEF